MNPEKILLSNPPEFLSILGANGFDFDKEKTALTMGFDVSADLTHSNGTIVQGGFITAMLDAAMAHLIILHTDGAYNPLSLNINVTFIAPGAPGIFSAHANLKKMGRSIAFSESELYQGSVLVATATATNKLILLSK